MSAISPSSPLNVLLVEDSRGDAILIEKALGSALPGAHEVTQTTTLAGARKLVAERSFDVALLDRSLPDAEGFVGLHSLQNMAPKLPVIFLTAFKDEHTALEAISQGAQDYLFKDRMEGPTIKRAVQYAVLRKQFEGMLILQANYDMLTGLANRLLFESRLDMALVKMKRHNEALEVLFLDLNGFKQVNDTYGHWVGDMLLKEVAQRLKQVQRPYDAVARFGGDEFAILLEHLPRAAVSEGVSQKIIQLFSEPIVLDNITITVGVSIGIATCNPGQNLTREVLMQRADAAMYRAKKNKRSSFVHFDETLDLFKIHKAV